MSNKLAIVIDVLENITGGAERQVYELLKAVDREKFQVWLYVLHQDSVPEEISRIASSSGRLRYASHSCVPRIAPEMKSDSNSIRNTQYAMRVECLGLKRIYDLKGIAAGMRFAKFLKKEKVDVVMTFHFGADIWGTYFAHKAKVPLIISSRRDEGFWRNKTHIKAYKWVNKWVDKVIAVSQAVQKMAIDEGVPEDKVELLYSGVDLSRFETKVDTATKRKEIGVPVDAKLIVCVGNFNPIKGHEYLIEAMAVVIKHVPNAHLILIGDGQLRESHKTQVTSHRLEKNVHFLGKRSDVPEILQCVDVCVLPSLSEGLSNALLEYMAAGKPVIATNVGGNPEVLLDGENGVLVESKDADALAREIVYLIADFRLDQDGRPSRHGGTRTTASLGREELGRNARKTVEERFDLRKQIKTLQDFIEIEIQRAKNPRILHLISSGGLFGAERVMLSLGKAMNMNGAAVWLGALNNTHNPHLEVIDEAKVSRIPCTIFDSKGQIDFSTVKGIARFARERKINLFHTHNYKATVLAALASLKTGIPVVTTNHLWTRAGKKLRFYEFIESLLLKFFVKRVVAVSDAIKQDMKTAGVPQSKIEVIYNGIEIPEDRCKMIDKKTEIQDNKCRILDKERGLTQYAIRSTQDVRREFGIPDNVVVVATIARLSPEKGHTFLFQAAQRLLAEKKDIVFLIVGDGASRQFLEDETAGLGIRKSVIFTGYRKDMDNIYAAADIIAQPSLREGIPITLLEAMVRCKPIIATDVGGVAHVIKDTRTGLLIPAQSVDSLYTSLKRVIYDAELRQRLGKQAFAFVKENYSVEKMANRYQEIYREVVSINTHI